MSILTDYTSYDEVRAVLGVSVEELEDQTLSLPLYVRMLTFELTDLASDMVDQYLAVWALTASARTSAQQKFFDVVQLYSAYSASKHLLTSLPLFAPKRITDGRAEFERQIDPFADTRMGVLAGFYATRKRLLSLYEALTSTTVAVETYTPGFTVSTGIATDPVTNV
jgi:hypothetical protein